MKVFIAVLVTLLVVSCIYAGAVTATERQGYRPPYLAEMIDEWTSIPFRAINLNEYADMLSEINNRDIEGIGDDFFGTFIGNTIRITDSIVFVIESGIVIIKDAIYNMWLAFKFLATAFTLVPIVADPPVLPI